MASTVVAVGLGLTVVAFTGRQILRRNPNIAQRMNEAMKKNLDETFSSTKYYKGGFDAKMNKREASLILGVPPNASKAKIKEAHKRLITINHPDRGGSPLIAAKINEAKDCLENKCRD